MVNHLSLSGLLTIRALPSLQDIPPSKETPSWFRYPISNCWSHPHLRLHCIYHPHLLQLHWLLHLLLLCYWPHRYRIRNRQASNSQIEAVRDVQDWLGRYGHTLVKLRTDAGSTEKSAAFGQALANIAVGYSASAAPETQETNPAERSIKSFFIQFKIIINSTRKFGKKDWGLSILSAEK